MSDPPVDDWKRTSVEIITSSFFFYYLIVFIRDRRRLITVMLYLEEAYIGKSCIIPDPRCLP